MATRADVDGTAAGQLAVILTNDEFTVLMIADRGAPLLAIGRWKVPIEALVARGLMRDGGSQNFGITPAGTAAMTKHSEALDNEMCEEFSKMLGRRNPPPAIDEQS